MSTWSKRGIVVNDCSSVWKRKMFGAQCCPGPSIRQAWRNPHRTGRRKNERESASSLRHPSTMCDCYSSVRDVSSTSLVTRWYNEYSTRCLFNRCVLSPEKSVSVNSKLDMSFGKDPLIQFCIAEKNNGTFKNISQDSPQTRKYIYPIWLFLQIVK